MKHSISMRALVLLVAAFCGTRFCSAVQILNDGQIITGTEKESLSFQMFATNGVPPYTWSDHYTERRNSSFSENGMATGWQGDDDSWLFDLPFEFSFYGKKYAAVYVNDNGTLSFGEALLDYNFDDDTFLNTPMLAPLWADLVANPGDIYIQTNSHSVTFRWQRRFYSDSRLLANFSATLCKNVYFQARFGKDSN